MINNTAPGAAQAQPWGVTTPRPPPITGHLLVAGAAVNGERSESAGREAPLTAGTETKTLPAG